MKTTIALLLITIIFIVKVNAQDTLFFKNRSIKTGKITAIGAGKITFISNDADGTITHTVYTKDVYSVKYKSGKEDTIPGNIYYDKVYKIIIKNKKITQQHLVNISLFALVKRNDDNKANEAKITYEYVFRKINLSVFVPISYDITNQYQSFYQIYYGYKGNNMDPISDNYVLYKKKGAGIGLKMFSNTQSNHTFWVGLGISYDDMRIRNYLNYQQKNVEVGTKKVTQFSKYIQVGYQNYITKKVYFAADLNLQIFHVIGNNHFDSAKVTAEIKLGYRIK